MDPRSDARSFGDSLEEYRPDKDDVAFRDPQELDDIQLDALRQQIRRLQNRSPFYRTTLAGRDPELITSRRWLEDLPLTTKDMYEASPESFRLDIVDANPYEQLWGLVHTTGTTTGRPTPFYDSGYDMLAYWLTLLRICKIAQMTANDMSVSLMPVPATSHNAFLAARDACSVLNAPYVSAFVGQAHPRFPVHRRTDYAVRLVERNRATVIWGLGNYVRHFVTRATELGADFSSVRLVWALGEACPRPMRDDLRARLGRLGADPDKVRINNGLGFTEMRGTFVECGDLCGCHNPSPDLFLWEVVDAETGRQLPDGELGSLALSHLDRRGTSLLRYLTGDSVLMKRDECPNCGRVGERIMPQFDSVYAVRNSEWVKFKGVLLHPSPIVSALLRITSLTEFQIVLGKADANDPLSMDRLVVRCAQSADDNNERAELENVIQVSVQNACEIRPDVEWTTPTQIFDPARSVKARRFVDERPNLLS